MVSESKKQEVKKIRELIEKYPVIGILDLFKMPSRQLQFIKKSLRGNALLKMSKKRLIKLALKDVKGKKDIERVDKSLVERFPHCIHRYLIDFILTIEPLR